MKKLCLIITAILILTLVGCSTDNHKIDSQSNTDVTETKTQIPVETSIETTTEKTKEQPTQSESVAQTSEETTKEIKQKESEKQEDERIPNSTTEKEKNDSSETISNIDLEYAVYQKTENGLSLTVKIPQKVGVGQKFVAYATVKNVSDNTINYALSSSSESKPKIKLSISAKGKSFTNIDTYGKGFTNDIVYKQIKPNEEINVTYNLCSGEVNGSTITDSNWSYLPKGNYSGVATFDFGGMNSKQWNNKKITVDFSVEVI